MSIWTKFLNVFNPANKNDKELRTGNSSKAFNAEKSASFDRLDALLKPLIRSATTIEVNPPSEPPEHSQLISHFGGQPYFETNESWPQMKNGRPLDFIFQVYNNGDLVLPADIKLIQFYYDWEEFPWETGSDGWLVKIYNALNTGQIIKINKPSELGISKYCEMNFKPLRSLPDWEGIDIYSPEAVNLCITINADEPWESYDEAVKKLTGEPGFRSQLGGYPKWVQGESTPGKNNGGYMKLLFQIDSENNAGLMWGDVGLVYAFYNDETKHVEFTLQCH